MSEKEEKDLRSRLLLLVAQHITSTAQIYNLTDDILLEVKSMLNKREGGR